MWRSTIVGRRASLSRQRGTANLPLPPQVTVPPPPPPHYQISLYQPFSSRFFSLFSPRISFHKNPRFFSHDADNSLTESPVSGDINGLFDFDEKHFSISSEFEEEEEPASSSSSSILDETNDTLKMDGQNESAVQVEVEDEIHSVDLEQLESVLSLLQSSSSTTADGSLELNLESMGLSPLHEEFVLSVFETPLVPGVNLIRFFKWVSKNLEFSVTTRAVGALVRAICSQLRRKDAYALWDLVKEVGKKENGVLNTEILNELICLFSRLGKGKAGFEVFNMFREFGCVPDADSYYFTIEALCRRSIFDWAGAVCKEMLNAGKLPGPEKIGKIIPYLCKGRKAKDAHLVYLSAKEKDRYPPKSSVNFLISSLCRGNETVHLALEMLEDFSGEERKYAIKPFSSVINGLCRIKDVEGAKELLFKMIDANPPPGNAVFNSIINSLSKAGDMEGATKLMKVMENRGLKPDVYTYSVIMSGYAKGGEMEAACKVLAEAKKKHSKLSPVTYHTLIRGYCKLEEFNKALKLLSEMKEYGVQPNADEYNKLIQSLCLKALDWGTAEKLMEEMKESGLHLSGITKGLIRAVKDLDDEGVETKEASVEA